MYQGIQSETGNEALAAATGGSVVVADPISLSISCLKDGVRLIVCLEGRKRQTREWLKRPSLVSSSIDPTTDGEERAADADGDGEQPTG